MNTRGRAETQDSRLLIRRASGRRLQERCITAASSLSVNKRAQMSLGPQSTRRIRAARRGLHMPNAHNAPHAQAAEEALVFHAELPDEAARYGVEGCCLRTFYAVVERN